MKIINFLIATLISISCYAQQNAFAPNGNLNAMNWNPAMTAPWNFMDVTLQYRQQWSGFENAPRTVFANAAIPIIDYSMSAGLGLMRDEAGPLVENSIRFNYAYHLEFGRRGGELSIGLNGLFSQFKLDNNRFIATDTDDQALVFSETSKISPNIGFGLFYKSVSKDDADETHFYIGAAAQQLLPSNLFFKNDNSSFNLERRLHGYGLLGAKFSSDYHSFEPFVWVNYALPNVYQIQLNLKFELTDIFWTTIAYHFDNTLNIQAGVILPMGNNYAFRIGAQGGYNIGQLSDVQKFSYEGIFQYLIYL